MAAASCAHRKLFEGDDRKDAAGWLRSEHMRSKMISIAFLSLLVGGGCSPIPHTRVGGDHRFICIDGVEYLDDADAVPKQNPTPHLKPDGTPYTCNY
jgi:hypothetical protein